MSTAYGSSLRNVSIPSLYNGVSQQPASIRLPSQCELQENAYPSLVDGLKKRPSTEQLAKLDSTVDSNRFVHFINRDLVERYTVILTENDLKVYTLDGEERTVTFSADKSYLECDDPNEQMELVTVADYTFIVNKTVTTQMSTDLTGGTLKGKKQTFSTLPTSGMGTGDVWEIEGDPNNSFDSYFVEWTGETWEETCEVGIEYKFDATTMPHQLVRESDGTFTFEVCPWADRLVGDEESNPNPSFIGNTIVDIFLHRNRLGLLSGENVILSTAPASDFNFFRESATILIDSDPIDTPAGHNKVSNLYHAVAFDRSLVLFSEQTQFILSAPNALTPASATLDVSTEFESDPLCRPVGAGPNLYFTVPRGVHTAIREYFVQDDVTTNDAADVTAHVPAYLPSGVFKLVSSSNEDLLLALTKNEPNIIYVYKFYWQGDEKVQSSWGKWIFDPDDTVLGVEMINSDLYIVVQRPDGTFIEKMALNAGATDAGMDTKILLDRRLELTGTYDSGSGETTWTLPYEYSGDVEAVLGPASGKLAGKRLALESVSPTEYKATGDYSGGAAYVGIPYTLRYIFSEQVLRDSQGNGIKSGRLMLRNFTINYTDSGYFRINVTPLYRNTYTYAFTGMVLGSGNLLINSLPIESGSFKVPVMSDSTQVTIEITNDTPLPSTFQSAEWVGLFHSKSTR